MVPADAGPACSAPGVGVILPFPGAETWGSGGTYQNATYDDYNYQYQWTKTWQGQGTQLTESATNHVTGIENGTATGWWSWSYAGGSGSGSGSGSSSGSGSGSGSGSSSSTSWSTSWSNSYDRTVTYPGFYEGAYYTGGSGGYSGGGGTPEEYFAYIGDAFSDASGSSCGGMFPFAFSQEELLSSQAQGGTQYAMALAGRVDRSGDTQRARPDALRESAPWPPVSRVATSRPVATGQAFRENPSAGSLRGDASGGAVIMAEGEGGEKQGGGFRLFGEEWVWPWSEEAGGVWETLGAYGRAAGRAAAGTASGAVAGAATGTVTGAGVGALAGGIPTGGAGAGPGALAGAGAGAVGGGILGAVSGLIRAAVATDAKDAAIGGAEAGAVGGAFGGAFRAYEAVRGLGSAAGTVRATAHGYQRLLERGWTLAEYNAVKAGGRVLTQADGAKVYILEVAPGKFNVLIENPQTNKVITAFRHIRKKSLEGLWRNYGWH